MKDEKLCLNRKKGERLHNWGKRGGSWSTEERVRCGWGGRWRGGGRKGGAVKWHSWQMTSPVSQSPLLSSMICHLHFWHFSSHYQITLTEWYFLILPALEHTKNNGLHMLSAPVLYPCLTLHFLFRVSRKYPVIFFFSSIFFPVMNMRLWKHIAGGTMEAISVSASVKLSGSWWTQPAFTPDPSNRRAKWDPASETITATRVLTASMSEHFRRHKIMTVCTSQWLRLF